MKYFFFGGEGDFSMNRKHQKLLGIKVRSVTSSSQGPSGDG